MSKAKRRVAQRKAFADSLEHEHKWGQQLGKLGRQIIHDERLAVSAEERRAELRAHESRQKNK